jgi:hypothetical protein
VTPKQQADKINAFIANWDNLVADTFFLAITKLEADLTNRVFSEHENALGGKLGQYSTVPTLIGAKSFASKTAANSFFSSIKKSKDDKTPSKWRTLKNGKHAYILDGGYKELRAIQGKQTSEINLQYTGELSESGIGVVVNGDDYQIKFRNQKSIDKGRGFEKRKGIKVFSPSEKEKELITEFVGNRIITELKEAFGNV